MGLYAHRHGLNDNSDCNLCSSLATKPSDSRVHPRPRCASGRYLCLLTNRLPRERPRCWYLGGTAREGSRRPDGRTGSIRAPETG